jgi:hypothetical protein
MLSHALILALLSLAPAAAARTEGRVLQATAARAYLDAGADDGLAPGAEVILRRGGAEVGRCRLGEVSARAAACAVAGARAGDAFALPARPAREEPRLLAPRLAPEVARARAAALAAAPIAVVQFAPPARGAPGAGPVAVVELTEVAWVATSADPFTATRAALSIRSAEVGLGLRLDLDAQAIRWTSRPSNPEPRFRPGDASQLYVWQASLTRDPGAGGAALALGRILPWRVPGATILDGATVGWRGDRWELGAFAGFAPEPSTLGVATDRASGGGYWGWDHAFGRGVTLRDEGRLAVVRSPELGTRFEAETRAAARLGRLLDLSGSVRLGVGDAQAPGALDAARLELSSRPFQHLRLSGWLAYDGLELPEGAEPAIYPGHSRRAEGSVTWEAGRNLRATVLGGVASDLTSGLDRQWIGPVLDLPRLLFRRGGLSVGYLEELGWSDGRSAWVQAVVRPWERVRVLGRLSWSHVSALAIMQDELAASLGLAAELTRAVSARLTVTGRGALPSGEGGTTEGGGSVFATVAARY